YMDTMRQIPVGVVMLNHCQQVVSSNEAAYELCKNMFPHKLQPVAHAVRTALSRLPAQRVSTTSYLETVAGQIYFKIVPFIVPGPHGQLENHYAVYLTPHTPQSSPLHTASAGQYNLTEREMEVVDLVIAGLNNKEIAEKLFISSHTVKTHMENIFKKLGVDRRAAIIHKFDH
ncbi:MAG: helix-turn-helix transcriptional regulator, partial [Chloroflexi bacterium]|nr:helix-turn-helix transcriptional regulator [Chloroflexota bacterium]